MTNFNKLEYRLAGISLFGLFMLLFIPACQDLDEDISGVFVADSFFATDTDYELAVNAVYSSLASTANSSNSGNRIGTNGFFSPHMGGDDMMSHFGLNKAPFRNIDAFQATANSVTLPRAWNTYYETIYRANVIIQAVQTTELAPEVTNPHVAQARMLRAFSYFFLAKMWGDVPLHTEDNIAALAEIAPSPYLDIMTLVISDLEWAVQHLQESAPSNKPSQMTRWGGKTLLADVYLKMAGWPTNDASYFAKAAKEAKDVIDSGVYTMYEDFAELWDIANHNAANPEIVFYFSQSFAAGGQWGNVQTRTTFPPEERGWTDVMSQNGWFYAFPEGYRKEVTFHTTFIDNNNTHWTESQLKHPFYAKYRSGSNLAKDGSGTHPHQSNRNTVIYRLPYLYFTYAEAQTMADGSPNADSYEYINMVRRRANKLDYTVANAEVDLPAGLSADEFREAVFEEKGWELACEQHRWNDLVRRDRVVEMNLKHRVQGEDEPWFGRPIETLPQEHFYYLPYQQGELTKNKLLNQRPGY